MKKIAVLLFGVALMTSCGGGSSEEAPKNDSCSVVECDSVCVDSTSVADTTKK